MICGFDEALSMIVTVPCAAPFLVGENVTLIVHFAVGATLVPQVEVTPNWALAFIDAIFNAAVPVLVSVTVSGELVVPTVCL